MEISVHCLLCAKGGRRGGDCVVNGGCVLSVNALKCGGALFLTAKFAAHPSGPSTTYIERNGERPCNPNCLAGYVNVRQVASEDLSEGLPHSPNEGISFFVQGHFWVKIQGFSKSNRLLHVEISSVFLY